MDADEAVRRSERVVRQARGLYGALEDARRINSELRFEIDQALGPLRRVVIALRKRAKHEREEAQEARDLREMEAELAAEALAVASNLPQTGET